MVNDNNTTGETGASCGVCGAWIQNGQTHFCHQYVPPSNPPNNPFPPPPTYVQPAAFPQWIDPNVLERIATALEKIARGMDKQICGICKKEFSHYEWENRCVNSDEPAHENCCDICNGTDDESELEKCTCGEGEGCCP